MPSVYPLNVFKPHHQLPPQSEEDIVVEAIREREAAEERVRRQKERDDAGYDRHTMEQSCQTEGAASASPTAHVERDVGGEKMKIKPPIVNPSVNIG